MSYGLLVKKNAEIKSCEDIAALMSHKTVVRRTDEEWPEEMEMIIRWGCTANTPKGVGIINYASGIHLVANKSGFRQTLRAHNSGLIPKTWLNSDGMCAGFEVVKNFPVVVRPSCHERGSNFNICSSVEELEAALSQCGENPYVSKFVSKTKEFRIFIVQGRVICVVEKCPNNTSLNTWGLAANWINYKWSDWPVEAVRKAVEAHNCSGLHFTAADVLQAEDGSYVISELNSAPELGGKYYAQKFASAFDWMIDNHREPIPTDLEQTDWKYYAHPSLSEKVVI